MTNKFLKQSSSLNLQGVCNSKIYVVNYKINKASSIFGYSQLKFKLWEQHHFIFNIIQIFFYCTLSQKNSNILVQKDSFKFHNLCKI